MRVHRLVLLAFAVHSAPVESKGPLVVDTLHQRMESFGSGGKRYAIPSKTTGMSSWSSSGGAAAASYWGAWAGGAAPSESAADRAEPTLHHQAERTAAPWSPEEALATRRPRAEAAAETAAKPRKSDWERHQQKTRIEERGGALEHADSALAFMEERAAAKLQADIEEVDHLIVRRHLLTDRRGETDADAAAIDAHAKVLGEAASAMGGDGQWGEAQKMNDEVVELASASAALRGTAEELAGLNSEIEQSTEDGKRMHSKVAELSKSRAALARQIHVLTVEKDHVQEKEETAEDLEAFEKAGYEGVTDEDDPYMKEAADALEHVSGWESDKLDENAVKAREAMTAGMKGNPGKAVQALRALSR